MKTIAAIGILGLLLSVKVNAQSVQINELIKSCPAGSSLHYKAKGPGNHCLSEKSGCFATDDYKWISEPLKTDYTGWSIWGGPKWVFGLSKTKQDAENLHFNSYSYPTGGSVDCEYQIGSDPFGEIIRVYSPRGQLIIVDDTARKYGWETHPAEPDYEHNAYIVKCDLALCAFHCDQNGLISYLGLKN